MSDLVLSLLTRQSELLHPLCGVVDEMALYAIDDRQVPGVSSEPVGLGGARQLEGKRPMAVTSLTTKRVLVVAWSLRTR
ncbi:MAG: hypothetical protein VYE68_00365 [Acidobacteriota bacterium]|nr:hypothetical protein [Acidobacteriota bacterium]